MIYLSRFLLFVFFCLAIKTCNVYVWNIILLLVTTEKHCMLLFPVALSLFLMSVNVKTPVVVENITLMCLRIIQKLIKPPAPTSKKNKVTFQLTVGQLW